MRFRVYRSRAGNPAYPLLLDVQSDFVSQLPTRVVIPLRPVATLAATITTLHPRVTIDGAVHVLATHEMASVPLRAIGAEVGSLEHEAHAITRAIDFLFEGY